MEIREKKIEKGKGEGEETKKRHEGSRTAFYMRAALRGSNIAIQNVRVISTYSSLLIFYFQSHHFCFSFFFPPFALFRNRMKES